MTLLDSVATNVQDGTYDALILDIIRFLKLAMVGTAIGVVLWVRSIAKKSKRELAEMDKQLKL